MANTLVRSEKLEGLQPAAGAVEIIPRVELQEWQLRACEARGGA